MLDEDSSFKGDGDSGSVSSDSEENSSKAVVSNNNNSRKKDKKDKKAKVKKENPGKGRFGKDDVVLGGMNVGLPTEEVKRKREDAALATAEKNKRKKAANSSDDSPANKNKKGSKFASDEKRYMLESIALGMGDQEATKNFFQQMPKSTRTETAVRNKIKLIRAELEKALLKVTEADLEKNGV
jgi:hypothetical protein